MPIIIITAYPEENCRRRALNAGAVAFLSKPFSEESLMDCLATALAGRSRKDLS
jgi:CheY-like chemotaxis protein